MLTTGVSTLTSCRPCIQSANTKIQPHTSWKFNFGCLDDTISCWCFGGPCHLFQLQTVSVMLTEDFHVHAGALDWREGYRWDLFLAVLQCPHLPPGCPGGPAAQPEGGREGGTATGCCFAVVCPVIHCRTHFIHNIDNKSFIMHLVTDYKLCSTVFCSLAE